MAQSISFLEIMNENYTCIETLNYTPSEEDVESLALDNDITGNVVCEYRCYNIGEGESATETLIDADILRDLYSECDDFEEIVKSEYGYDADVYQSGTIKVYVEEDY